MWAVRNQDFKKESNIIDFEALFDKKDIKHFHTTSKSYLILFKKENDQWIQRFRLRNDRSWNINIHHQNLILKNYFLFHLPDSGINEYINFQQSKFYYGIRYGANSVRGYVAISSFEQYKEQLKMIVKNGEKLYLLCEQLNFDLRHCDVDIMRVGYIGSYYSNGYYVSESLMKAIMESSFTGMRFEEMSTLEKCTVKYS